jgi:F0F1-type ATP synthase membrane subunit c/vacuolar-type H+-ATPase subunit K
MITPEVLHYFSAAIAIVLGALGGSIGQGIATFNIVQATQRQPMSSKSNFRAMLIGLALIESGCIITLVTSILTLLSNIKDKTIGSGLAELGAGLVVGMAALAISIASSFVVKAAAESISRQPFFAGKITTLMLLSQTIIEAPVIFAFIIALFIRTSVKDAMDLAEGLKYLAAGITLAVGAIGTSIGQSLCASASCRAVGLNKDAYSKILPFNLINQAIIETPAIFCMLVAFAILFTNINPSCGMMTAIICLTAAVTIAIAACGTSSGMGLVASKGSSCIALDLTIYPVMLKTTLLAVAFIESSMIYALIIALLVLTR